MISGPFRCPFIPVDVLDRIIWLRLGLSAVMLPEVALLTDAFVLAFLIWYRMRKLVVPPSPARALSVPYKLLWALPTTVAEVAVIDETDPPMGSVVSPCPAQAFGPFSPGAVMVCTQVGPANTMASRAMARLKGGYSTVVSCVRSPSGCLLLPFHARHTARESGQIKEKT